MSDDFASTRCIPWLISRAEVRVDGAPEPVGPGAALLRGRLRLPRAARFKFGGFAALVTALLVLMGASRPARAEGQTADHTVARSTGYALGGLGVGAIALGRRFDRGAPGVSILCLAAGADLRPAGVEALAAGARERMSAAPWPEGPVWMISQVEPPLDSRARARELGLRVFFTDRAGRIVEA